MFLVFWFLFFIQYLFSFSNPISSYSIFIITIYWVIDQVIRSQATSYYLIYYSIYQCSSYVHLSSLYIYFEKKKEKSVLILVALIQCDFNVCRAFQRSTTNSPSSVWVNGRRGSEVHFAPCAAVLTLIDEDIQWSRGAEWTTPSNNRNITDSTGGAIARPDSYSDSSPYYSDSSRLEFDVRYFFKEDFWFLWGCSCEALHEGWTTDWPVNWEFGFWLSSVSTAR